MGWHAVKINQLKKKNQLWWFHRTEESILKEQL